MAGLGLMIVKDRREILVLGGPMDEKRMAASTPVVHQLVLANRHSERHKAVMIVLTTLASPAATKAGHEVCLMERAQEIDRWYGRNAREVALAGLPIPPSVTTPQVRIALSAADRMLRLTTHTSEWDRTRTAKAAGQKTRRISETLLQTTLSRADQMRLRKIATHDRHKTQGIAAAGPRSGHIIMIVPLLSEATGSLRRDQ